MDPGRFSQGLTLLGGAFYLYLLLFRPDQGAMAFAIGLILGSAVLAYGEKPFPVPLFAGIAALIALLQLFFGHPLPYALGLLLGVGLPYLLYRLRRPRR
ncbi:hypothetical protein YIM1640_13420 [Thermus oshimai]|jgi:hypothetical protein|uniref:hypothetical protein n=1 Tax=Thermus TaxID=270 RepID=UPI00309A43B3